MLSRELEVTLNLAFKNARERRHEFMTVEHLLLALLDDASASNVLRACGADLERLRQDLVEFIDSTIPTIPETKLDHETQPTHGFQRVLQRAVFQVNSANNSEVVGANVVVAIFSEQESQAVYFLRLQNVARIDVVNYISHGISKYADQSEHRSDTSEESTARESDGPQEEESLLNQFATNLNEQAEQGRTDPLIGRSAEVERVSQILIRRRKNNPLLVGESGVGKTAIAEGLARLIVEGKVPEPMLGSTVYSLDMGSLLAGTKYRGDFEKRLKGIISELVKKDKSVLFIDEIHTIIGAGAASGGVMDASNILKPLLSSGQLRCVGSTTFQEYRGIFEKDNALSRRFQKIDVPEPSIAETYEILKGLKSRFEDHHQLKFTNPALKVAAELSSRHINDRFLPDKAIDVIDEAGAYQRLQPESRRKKTVGVSDIELIISKIARIPAKSVSSSDKAQLKGLADKLKMVVFGQDKAIDALATSIKLARAGLREGEKPIGSFLFAGPTGVGKTEVSRQLANVLGVELVRFDMSEYMERHTVSRLIGAPPGYVGYDQGGLLTEAVTQQPHSVILLDEVEKAHPDVFNLLLQVMDHGTLTDNNGRKADFRNVILIMTTNAGAELMSRASIGFSQQDHATDGMEAIKKMFTPEFRNRLDSIVQFGELSLDVIKTVVDKFLVQLQSQLDDKKVFLEVDDDARLWLAENGYDAKMGARPMDRLIQEKIKKPLAEEVLFGSLAEKGGTVLVSVEDNDLTVTSAIPA
ncbi:MAG: ATP-dependent Clp protease ATP-binding subunit ClpA [Porticoccaceae bacterium]|nr:ATP-dependent Clp protease ATP-binding subunit ClpA [Porticoccaceae bacterium]